MKTNSKKSSTLIDLNEGPEFYFSNTIIPQLFVDAQLILRKFNTAAMKHFKLKAEFLGMPLEEIQENFSFPANIAHIKRVIDTGGILEEDLQTMDMRWYQMNILPYSLRNGNKTDGVIITFLDITSRINQLKEQQELVKVQALLLDTITHDIKNPILALELTIHLLKKLPENGMEKFPVLLKNIETTLQEMKAVVGDPYRSYNQISSSKKKVAPKASCGTYK